MQARLVLLWAAVALLPSCLHFEKQTVLLRRDAAKDTIDIRIVYEGIYSSNDEADAVADDRDMLAKLAGAPAVFALADPLFNFDLAAPASGAEKLLAKHATLKNGSLFLNADKELSAWQDLHIEKASELIAGLNALMNAEVAGGMFDKSELDATSKKLLRDAASRKHTWLVLDDDGLRVAFALSAADVAKTKDAALRGFAAAVIEAATSDRFEEKTDAGAMLRTLRDNPLSIVHRGSETTIGLSGDGVPGAPLRFVWSNAAVYRANLTAKATDPARPLPAVLGKVDAKTTVAKLTGEFSLVPKAPKPPKPPK